MRLLVFMLPALLHAGVVSFERDGNLVRLKLTGGNAEIEWLTEAAFRYSFGEGASRPALRDRVPLSVLDLGATLQLRTRYLTVEAVKSPFLLRVRTAAGRTLMEENAGPERTEDGIRAVRRMAPGERFYGFGARTDEPLDARGSRILSSHPFFLSTAGYGQYHTAPKVLFDAGRTSPEEFRIVSPGKRLEYYFYYGPTPKEVFEQHFQAVPPRVAHYRPTDFEVLPASQVPVYATALPPRATLAGSIRALAHSSLSAQLAPAFDLESYGGDPGARALASIVPIVTGKQGSAPALRESLYHYFIAYIQESRDRGFPMIHALPVQFPADQEAPKYSDEFMLGDELLAAPFADASPVRRVYLPMGAWTELATNQRYKGRQTIEVRARAGIVPLFAKSGSIVPLQGPKEGEPLRLHYFPDLGGEFFLYEVHSGETTQFHASPSAGYYRLEIETRETRLYEWVIHHAPCPAAVNEGERSYSQAPRCEDLKPRSWCHDSPAGNLHVVLEARAGEDRIVNVRLP